MAEEQRWQEGHRLCANNCGFFGSPATLDLCSKCYCDRRAQEEAPVVAAAATSCHPAVFSSSSSSSTSSPALLPPSSATEAAIVAAAPSLSAAEAVPGAKAAGRCAGCRKRVGLTGFACRCGGTFCGAHRYPERHDCGFDFKAAGRDAIARANPVVKGDKLKDKI